MEKVKGTSGSLIVKEYPTKHASTETIKNHLNRLKNRGIEPDLIAIDYADLLKPVRFQREKETRARRDLRRTERIGKNYEVLSLDSITNK